MNANSETKLAIYFGIAVESLAQMDHCSLVRHQDREFVVDTADLALRMSFAKAA